MSGGRSFKLIRLMRFTHKIRIQTSSVLLLCPYSLCPFEAMTSSPAPTTVCVCVFVCGSMLWLLLLLPAASCSVAPPTTEDGRHAGESPDAPLMPDKQRQGQLTREGIKRLYIIPLLLLITNNKQINNSSSYNM